MLAYPSLIYRLNLPQVLTSDECIPDICDVKRCRKRVYPKFIEIAFCLKAKCKFLDLPRIQCKLKPKPKGRVSLEHREHTLRMHQGKDKGWTYKKLK